MGKSITSTLFALLVKDGTYTLEQPAPVPEWQKPGDPRGAIRNIDLLRMSSGLRFIATQDPDYSPDKGYPDHFYIYTGAIDAFEYSVNVPLQFPPNTEGRYRNCDPLTIGHSDQAGRHRSAARTTSRGRSARSSTASASGGRCSKPIRTATSCSPATTTARRATGRASGLLYLQDGMWQGTRILPEGWAKFVSPPPPGRNHAPTGRPSSNTQPSRTTRPPATKGGGGEASGPPPPPTTRWRAGGGSRGGGRGGGRRPTPPPPPYTPPPPTTPRRLKGAPRGAAGGGGGRREKRGGGAQPRGGGGGGGGGGWRLQFERSTDR